MMYCAGSKRLAVPNARFLLHGIGLTLAGNIRLEEKSLQEHINSMRTDAHNIARVVSSATGKPVGEVEKTILEGKVLTAEQAKQWGLAQEISETLFPAGSHVISITAQRGAGPILSDEERLPDSIDRLSGLATIARAEGTTY